jgi:hypothetical protein
VRRKGMICRHVIRAGAVLLFLCSDCAIGDETDSCDTIQEERPSDQDTDSQTVSLSDRVAPILSVDSSDMSIKGNRFRARLGLGPRLPSMSGYWEIVTKYLDQWDEFQTDLHKYRFISHDVDRAIRGSSTRSLNEAAEFLEWQLKRPPPDERMVRRRSSNIPSLFDPPSREHE